MGGVGRTEGEGQVRKGEGSGDRARVMLLGRCSCCRPLMILHRKISIFFHGTIQGRILLLEEKDSAYRSQRSQKFSNLLKISHI